MLLTEGKGLEIDWADGHKSAWAFAWLREACPCATCIEQRKLEDREPGQAKPKPAQLLPMYSPPVKPTSAHPVGLERRAPRRNLLVGLSAPPMPVRRVPFCRLVARWNPELSAM